MDQRGEEDHNSQLDSSDLRRKSTAAAVPDDVHGELTDQRNDGGFEAETAGVIKEEQVEMAEVEASAPLFAHPFSLLQPLLRACAGCLVGLHGYCSDNNDSKPAAAAIAESSTPQEGEAGGGGDDDDKAAAGSSEVATPVLAARRPPTQPGPPEEGSGGHGGSHN
ncbi:uncharacterized protein LOC8079552 [Sorghum bicolor]|uniref:Uncharacterized protein n=1 Tax=Sorghum bicolor TaxID=4558 RepID=C5Y8X0_SORBI|nr:uncharacterized protein LOC8079552 [Sorghum bicolor]EES12943.1 hypothetical protein SORBI_3006G234200 [Sorghum bicolor]|eukprot:XP_002448615.1 uncharacterized protein LOC8079552 [Sorghum bicolor]